MKPEKSQKSLSHFSWTPHNPVTVPAPCSAPFLPKKMHQKKWIHQPQNRLRGEKEGLSREAPALAGTATNLPPLGNGRLGPVPGLPQSWLPSPWALPHGCRGGMLLSPLHGHGQRGPVAGSRPSRGGGGWSCRARAAQGGEPGMILQAEAKQERSGRGNVLSAGYQQASAAMPRHHVTSLLACLGSSCSRRQRQSCPCLVERPRLRNHCTAAG